MAEYEVTVGDIRNYLATLAPDEVAGKTGDIQHCLIARALAHKYDKTFHVGSMGFWEVAPYSEVLELGDEMVAVRATFDYVPLGQDVVQDRTRAEVEASMPQLKGDANA